MKIAQPLLQMAIMAALSAVTAVHAEEPLVDKAERTIKKGASKAAEGIEKGVEATKEGVSKGLEATDKAVRKADGWVKDKTGRGDKGSTQK
jgi:hypothetical protein